MARHDFSNSLSGRVGVFDTAFAVMRGASKQANSAQQSQTTNHIVPMYLFLTQYTTPDQFGLPLSIARAQDLALTSRPLFGFYGARYSPLDGHDLEPFR